MGNQYILAIDQSTSGTKALLVDDHGEILKRNSLIHSQISPQPDWSEHDPEEIYENVKKLIRNVLEGAVPHEEIKALAITNQRETVVVWDKNTGQPIYNAIVWQCRRTTDICRELVRDGYENEVKKKTGLTLDPYFSASKVKWILDNVEGAKQKAENGELLLGTIDSWLIWKLTGGHVHATDYSNASRTLLFNIHTLQWDAELLGLFGIPPEMLPSVKGSDESFGQTTIDGLLSSSVPITGVIGDSQGALFGQKCFHAGMAKATYGTGTSVMMFTGEMVDSSGGLVTSIAWGLGGKVSYVLEGIINSTGDSIKWLKEEMGLVQEYDEIEYLATSKFDTQGVYFIPAFVGLGAPYWSPETRAAILGMNRNTEKAHVVRAAVESIAYQVKDIIELIRNESNIVLKELKVDGGAINNKFLLQFQADILKTPVVASSIPELSSLGSVYLAGLGVGVWNSVEEISILNQEQTLYASTMSEDLRKKYYEGWKKAIGKIVV